MSQSATLVALIALAAADAPRSAYVRRINRASKLLFAEQLYDEAEELRQLAVTIEEGERCTS